VSARRLTTPSLGLGALLTALVALGPLSTDLYLPSLPTLAEVFATDAARVQLTLSVYLAGFAVAQLAYGALSDRFGRRPVMLGGLVIYFVASLGCLFAASIEQLIAARFVQAIGACAGPVLGRAIVRDAWGPLEAARALAYISGAMALAPLVGPALGGVLTVTFGWQANFALLAIFSGLQVLAVWYWLGETNAHRDPAATQLASMAGNFRVLLADRQYVGCVLALGLSYSALFAFISGSSFLLIGTYGLSPAVYGLCFGLVVAGYIAGTQIAGRLVRRAGVDRLLLAGGWLGAAAGSAMLALRLGGVGHLAAVLAPMFFVTVSVGLAMPSAAARALAPYPKMAGAASSLMGFLQMGLAALVGLVVGHGVAGSQTVLPATVAACTLLVPLCYIALVGRQRA
jgi:DHA1 family bicyclomycin/chloramphenicol resistance-like MFS transporter